MRSINELRFCKLQFVDRNPQVDYNFLVKFSYNNYFYL